MSAAVETMAYAGEVPWHGLGREVPADLTPAQMLDAADLNWEVHKVKSFIEYSVPDPDSGVPKKRKIYTGQEALVRSTDGRILTNVGPGWEPVQNEEAFEFFNDWIMAGDMEMHTAGSLRDGQIVWALARVKESFDLFGGDEVDSYLLFSNPHRYGQSIDIRFTPIRVVCQNTLTLSLQTTSKNAVTLTHRKKFDADEVKEAMGIASTKLQTYKEAAEFLGSVRFTDEKLREYFDGIFPVSARGDSEKEHSRNSDLLMELVETQPGAKYAEGTWWSAFNAVTYMTDHLLSRSDEKRLENAWFGHMRSKKIAALEKAKEFAEAA